MAHMRTPTSIGVNLVSGPTYSMQKTKVLLLLRLSFTWVRCPKCLNPQTFESIFLETLSFSSPCQQKATSGINAFLFQVNVACCYIANNVHRQLLACHACCFLFESLLICVNIHCFHTISMWAQSAFEIFKSQMKKIFLFLVTMLSRECGFSVPWLFAPREIWPPAVNTDPTINASLAEPYNQLRTKLCSALPIRRFL